VTNGLSLNLKKTKIMKFESNQQNNASFQITYRDELINIWIGKVMRNWMCMIDTPYYLYTDIADV
jgi:hypothetical protein